MDIHGLKETKAQLLMKMDEKFQKYKDDDNLIIATFLNPNNKLR